MKNILLCLIVLIGLKANGQKLPDFGLNKVRITLPDKTIQTELLPVGTEPAIESSAIYYWYSANAVHTTQGGFSGRLLNGKYSEYYLNKNLKEQGFFKNGLKTGIWKAWTDRGLLSGLYSYKNGAKSGPFNLYDEQGNISQTGTYHLDKLSGTFKTFHGQDSVTVLTYRDGKLMPKGNPASFWQKVNIFKKRSKTEAGSASPKKQPVQNIKN